MRDVMLAALERLEPPRRDAIVDRLLGGAPPFVRTLGSGVRLHIDPRDRIERRFAIRSYERPLLRFLARTLRSGDTVVDGGAHAGYIALHAARAVAPGGLVLAVEPDPANRTRLEANVALNDLPVRVVDAALSDTTATARFTRDLTPGETGWGSLLADPGERSEAIEVQTMTIDTLAADTSPVRLIKLDVQGAEHAALVGAEQTLRQHRPIVVVETVDVWWGTAQTTTVADVRSLLTHHGYREHALTHSGRLCAPTPDAATGVFVVG